MPVKALWFDGRPNTLVSSDQNTLIQREKGRVADDVSAESNDYSLFVSQIAHPFTSWDFKISMFLYNRWKQKNF
jgi:hypothetical protein